MYQHFNEYSLGAQSQVLPMKKIGNFSGRMWLSIPAGISTTAF
jgi:hypothetical protein